MKDFVKMEICCAGGSIFEGNIVYKEKGTVFPVADSNKKQPYGMAIENALPGADVDVAVNSPILVLTNSAVLVALSEGDPVFACGSITVDSGSWADEPIGLAISDTDGAATGEPVFIVLYTPLDKGVRVTDESYWWRYSGTTYNLVAGSAIFQEDMVYNVGGSLFPAVDNNTYSIYGVALNSAVIGGTVDIVAQGIMHYTDTSVGGLNKGDIVYADGSQSVDDGTVGDVAVGVAVSYSNLGLIYVKIKSGIFSDPYTHA